MTRHRAAQARNTECSAPVFNRGWIGGLVDEIRSCHRLRWVCIDDPCGPGPRTGWRGYIALLGYHPGILSRFTADGCESWVRWESKTGSSWATDIKKSWRSGSCWWRSGPGPGERSSCELDRSPCRKGSQHNLEVDFYCVPPIDGTPLPIKS